MQGLCCSADTAAVRASMSRRADRTVKDDCIIAALKCFVDFTKCWFEEASFQTFVVDSLKDIVVLLAQR